MASLELILAGPDKAILEKLKSVLQNEGYNIIYYTDDGNDCLHKIRSYNPDLLIIDYNIETINGYRIAATLDEDRICGGIVLMNESQRSMLDGDNSITNFAYLTKPLNKNILMNTIEMIYKNTQNVIRLEKEIDLLKKKLETRKLVEKAKGIIMQNHGIPESEAFRRIQKQSMDTGTPINEIAKAIIITSNL